MKASRPGGNPAVRPVSIPSERLKAVVIVQKESSSGDVDEDRVLDRK